MGRPSTLRAVGPVVAFRPVLLAVGGSVAFEYDAPWVTAEVTGTGGVFKASPADFEVEEIPLYSPGGEGPHLYLWIEKTGVPADKAVRRVGKHFGCKPRDVGQAGNKDARAVTRQWLSVLDERGKWDPSTLTDLDLGDGLRVLKASRHRNRLKTGHLRGNLFRIIIRDVSEGAEANARAALDLLSTQGMANFYGPQRFGGGDNIRDGLAILAGGSQERTPPWKRRLLASAVQSWIFNRVLQQRIARGDLHKILDGDVCIKKESGGRFEAEDLAAEQVRFEAGEIVHTGPMVGHKARLAVRAAGAHEAEALGEAGVEPQDFKVFGRLARGARRENLIHLEAAEVVSTQEGLQVRFALPKGSYATVVLDEIMKIRGSNGAQARRG